MVLHYVSYKCITMPLFLMPLRTRKLHSNPKCLLFPLDCNNKYMFLLLGMLGYCMLMRLCTQ